MAKGETTFDWNALLVPRWSRSWHKHATNNPKICEQKNEVQIDGEKFLFNITLCYFLLISRLISCRSYLIGHLNIISLIWKWYTLILYGKKNKCVTFVESGHKSYLYIMRKRFIYSYFIQKERAIENDNDI